MQPQLSPSITLKGTEWAPCLTQAELISLPGYLFAVFLFSASCLPPLAVLLQFSLEQSQGCSVLWFGVKSPQEVCRDLFPTVCWPAGIGINPSLQAHTHQQAAGPAPAAVLQVEQQVRNGTPRYCTMALPVMAGMELMKQCPLQPLIPGNSQEGLFHHLRRVQTSSACHILSASSSCTVRGVPALAPSLCQKKWEDVGS